MKTLIIILSALLALNSCGYEKIIPAEGTQTTREFTFNGESRTLSVTNTFNVILDKNIPEGKAIIETDAGVMKHVLVRSEGDKVLIRLKGRWKISPVPMNVRISPVAFKNFHATGACEIIAEEKLEFEALELSATGVATICFSDMQVGSVDAAATGTSSIILKGRAEEVDFSATGVSEIEASGLACKDAEVRATGTSIIHVNAAGSLTGSNIGMSTVRYSGSPAVLDVQNIGMSSLQKWIDRDKCRSGFGCIISGY